MRWESLLSFVTLVLVAVTLFQVVQLGERLEALETVEHQEVMPGNVSAVSDSMPVVAVTRDREGVIGNMSLRVIPGNNNVLVDTNPFLQAGLQYSLNKAVAVAKQRTGGYGRDFIYSFTSDSQLLGGESAGAAAALLAMSALGNQSVKDATAITGTVTADGSIGRVGGVFEKAKAAGEAGYDLFVVPEGQAEVTYYETRRRESPYLPLVNRELVPKQVDLRDVAEDRWGLTVREASSVNEAAEFLLE